MSSSTDSIKGGAHLELAGRRAAASRRLTITLSAVDAFEKGMDASNTFYDSRRGGVVLYDRLLIEDDGPGISSDAPWQTTDRAPSFEVCGNQQLKKILHVDHPDALQARLYLPPGAIIEFNGHRLESAADDEYPQVPVALLKEGDNEVLLLPRGNAGTTIKAAARKDILRNDPQREDRPPRSFTSTDGGKTWNGFDGEFMVRLHLVQYAIEGSFVSPVLDLARQDNSILASPVSIESLDLSAKAQTPLATEITLAIRSGTTPVSDPAHWSDWREAHSESQIHHRYAQWKAILRSNNPKLTPLLQNVTIEAEVTHERPPSWADDVTEIARQNPEIRYTSIPFAYENPQHPRLVALRQKYRLDEVVAGSKSEMEKFVKLRDWVAHQWKYKPPAEKYPAWDADEILTGRYGFCVQYAIVYMQCAISLGYQTRFLFANHPGACDVGHEVCEVWSNEYQKWIFMDPSEDNNLFCIDPQSGVPMSMLEIHDLLIKTYYDDKEVSRESAPKHDKPSGEIAICYGSELAPSYSNEKTIDGRYPVPRMWMLLRYMPRNNYLTQPYPVPIRQGAHWDWSDYSAWEGAPMPRSQWRYRHFTARRADLDWTINQVRFDVMLETKPGNLRVQMGTVTPGFDTFLVRFDNLDWQPSDSIFAWKLNPGSNRLKMRVRTNMGVEGPVSFLELDYHQE